ncbi:MAG: L,D-transpeptidase family protein [Candidatus Competibacterales bacterium]
MGIALTPLGLAASYPLPPLGVDVVGQVQVVTARAHETLLDIARRHNLGHDEIIQANPGVDRWLPGAGAKVVLPTRYVLPTTERKGIVLNLPEMRLYYYPEPLPGQTPVVVTHPVSIGRADWRTPLGQTRITAKQKNPPWYPPASIKAEHAAAGDPLPDRVPPGPDNPLGDHALRLGLPSYLIHGTNRPFGIGMRVTHGCIRMYPEDIAALFDRIPVGTPVTIVNQPVKVGSYLGQPFVEIHTPLDEEGLDDPITLQDVVAALKAQGFGPDDPIDLDILMDLMDRANGIAAPLAS